MTAWILVFSLLCLLLLTIWVYDQLVTEQYDELTELREELSAANKLLDFAVFTNIPAEDRSAPQLRLIKEAE